MKRSSRKSIIVHVDALQAFSDAQPRKRKRGINGPAGGRRSSRLFRKADMVRWLVEGTPTWATPREGTRNG